MSNVWMLARKWNVIFAVKIKFLLDDSKWSFAHFANQDGIENIVGDARDIT